MRGKKNTQSVLAQTPMSLFAVPMDARTYHFHRTVGYLENGSKNPNFKSNDDNNNDDDHDDGNDNEPLRRSCCVKRLTRHMARIPFEGGVGEEGGGSLSFGRSGIRGRSPPLCFAK